MAEEVCSQSGVSSSSDSKEVDAVILQVVVDDQQPVTRGLEDFEFNAEDKSVLHSERHSCIVRALCHVI